MTALHPLMILQPLLYLSNSTLTSGDKNINHRLTNSYISFFMPNLLEHEIVIVLTMKYKK